MCNIWNLRPFVSKNKVTVILLAKLWVLDAGLTLSIDLMERKIQGGSSRV